MARFTPVGPAREHAVVLLRRIVEAIAADDTTHAAALLDSVPPESPDNATATVAGCIGVALGLLDEWLSGHDPQAPGGLGPPCRPSSRALGRRTRRHRHPRAGPQGTGLRSLDTLLIRQGGKHVLYGSALGARSRHPNLGPHQRHRHGRSTVALAEGTGRRYGWAACRSDPGRDAPRHHRRCHCVPRSPWGRTRRVRQWPTPAGVCAAELSPADPAMHWRSWPRLCRRRLGPPSMPSRCACVLATSALCSADRAPPRSQPDADALLSECDIL